MNSKENLNHLKSKIRRELERRGFDPVRFTRPPLGEAAEQFKRWIESGFYGEMGYLSRREAERTDPTRLMTELRSVIVLAHGYDSGLPNTHQPQEGHISRYAWGRDYHDVLKEKLLSFERWLLLQGEEIRCYCSVDAQPVLEKAWAQKAGLGWRGKHTNIINAERGSYFFLSTILTNLPLDPDPETEDRCGTCTQCMDVCPTRAIVAPYVLDARLCISYLTIELKGPIPRNLRPLIGNRVFGCDDCQEVCPWNRFSRVTTEKQFLPRPEIRNRPLRELLCIDPPTFQNRFKDSAISRPKWKGFMRNVLVAAGNSGDRSLAAPVREKLGHPEPLVRGHAVWAYHRLLGEESGTFLQAMEKSETDVFVREELRSALASFS